MKNIEKLNEINKLFEIEDKEKVVKSLEYNFYAIESLKDNILISPDYLKCNDIESKYCILKEIYSKRFFDFQEEMEEIPKCILEDIKKEEELERRVKNGEECFSQEEMKKGITYKLQDERIFQFFRVDDGFEFSLFDKKGEVQDGGAKIYRYFDVELEKLPKNYILEELSKMISPILNLDIIKDENNKRLKDGLMEEDIKNIQIEDNLIHIVNLFMNENDERGLKELYDITKDKLVKILIDWRDEYGDMVDEPNTYAGNMYQDIFSLVWDKYKLSEVQEAINNSESIEKEEELE